jgi:WD40 repeat protein
VDVSPDGRLLAVARGHVVRVYDLATGKQRATLTGHTADAGVVAFSRDGARLVTVGPDAVRVWDAGRQEGPALADFPPETLLRTWQTSPGGHWIVVGGEIRRTDGTAKHVIRREGGWFAVSGADRFVVWRRAAPTGARLVVAPADPPRDYDFRLLDTRTGAERVLQLDEGKPWWWTGGFAVSTDGTRLAALSGPSPQELYETERPVSGADVIRNLPQRVLRVWDLATGKPLFTCDVVKQSRYSSIDGLSFTADGRLVVEDDQAVRVLDGTTGAEQAVVPFNRSELSTTPSGRFDGSGRAVVSPDGTRMAVAGGQAARLPSLDRGSESTERPEAATTGWVRLWDMRTRKELPRMTEIGEKPRDVIFSPDGSRLVTVDVYAVQVWDPAAGQLLLTYPLPDFNRYSGRFLTRRVVPAVSFSPDGHKLHIAWPCKAPNPDARVTLDATPRPQEGTRP